MKAALNLLFWGLLFTMIRLELGVDFDLLPEPIGYLLIALGSFTLGKSISQASIASMLASLMIFISIPTISIDMNKITHGPWQIYGHLLLILQLILIFFIFTSLTELVKVMKNKAMQDRTQGLFSLYMVLHLTILALLSFSGNLPDDFVSSVINFLSIVSLIMNIAFLVLIRTIRKYSPVAELIHSD